MNGKTGDRCVSENQQWCVHVCVPLCVCVGAHVPLGKAKRDKRASKSFHPCRIIERLQIMMRAEANK